MNKTQKRNLIASISIKVILISIAKLFVKSNVFIKPKNINNQKTQSIY